MSRAQRQGRRHRRVKKVSYPDEQGYFSVTNVALSYATSGTIGFALPVGGSLAGRGVGAGSRLVGAGFRRAVSGPTSRFVDARRFRIPFTSSSSSRAVAAVNEASVASGLTGRNLVDKVLVRSANSAFKVQSNGRRILYLNKSVVNQSNHGMLLREAAHELVHAQQYAKLLARAGGNVATARRAFNVSPRSYRYAVDEVVAETLARWRIGNYLGRFSQETLEWSNNYLRRWQSIMRARR